MRDLLNYNIVECKLCGRTAVSFSDSIYICPDCTPTFISHIINYRLCLLGKCLNDLEKIYKDE